MLGGGGGVILKNQLVAWQNAHLDEVRHARTPQTAWPVTTIQRYQPALINGVSQKQSSCCPT